MTERDYADALRVISVCVSETAQDMVDKTCASSIHLDCTPRVVHQIRKIVFEQVLQDLRSFYAPRAIRD